MTKIAVVCSPGVGDAVILQIAAHHLALVGYEVVVHTPHRFGKWLKGVNYGDWRDCDAIYLQHDNGAKSREIQSGAKEVYTFYGSYNLVKHPPLKQGFDFVADLNKTMVENVVESLRVLFGIEATSDNGFRAPPGLVHRKYIRRVAIHTTSGEAWRNWPLKKFKRVVKWLERQGYEPEILSPFPSLEALTSYLYESGYFLGNDSGPGHIASLLKIPHLIIGRQERHMRHWRPGWLPGAIVTPPKWVPNWKGFRWRETKWKSWIPVRSVIRAFNKCVVES